MLHILQSYEDKSNEQVGLKTIMEPTCETELVEPSSCRVKLAASTTDSFVSVTSTTTTFKTTRLDTQSDLNNPFASIVTRTFNNIASPTERDRYWVHDRVQDELRHDFRNRQVGKTATEVARAYFDSVPKEVTSEIDCEKIISKFDGKTPDLEVDQWKALYATAFLERCEKNGW
jgi:hypothetical protein